MREKLTPKEIITGILFILVIFSFTGTLEFQDIERTEHATRNR